VSAMVQEMLPFRRTWFQPQFSVWDMCSVLLTIVCLFCLVVCHCAVFPQNYGFWLQWHQNLLNTDIAFVQRRFKSWCHQETGMMLSSCYPINRFSVFFLAFHERWEYDLSLMYWIPKLHKHTHKQRYIAGTAICKI
jgi:hypothetical protein